MIQVFNFLDFGWSIIKKENITKDHYIQHVLMRSSAYTYRHATQISGIVAGASDKDLKHIFDYGSYLGLAFQLIDDIFNLRPRHKSWGKVIAEDLTEGKRSLLMLYTLDKANDKDKRRFIKILDSHTENEKVLIEAIEIIEKYRIFERVEKEARDYVESAINCIRKTNISKDYISLLIEFANYVTDRKI